MNSLFAEKIIFSANNMTGKSGDSNTTTTLSGNGYIKTESMEIQAENIELSGEDYRYIKANGNVKGKNLEANMDFTCDSLEYDRETKIAKLQGNVDLLDVENEVKAQAQMISYDQNSDIAVLQVKINLTQKDNVCSGSYAVYYKKDQILELSGNAQIKQKEDTFRAQHITLNMETQDITLGGNVKGTVTDSKTKDDVKENTTEKTTEETEDKDGTVDTGSGINTDTDNSDESTVESGASESESTESDSNE